MAGEGFVAHGRSREEKCRREMVEWKSVPSITSAVEGIFFYLNVELDIYIEIHSRQRGISQIVLLQNFPIIPRPHHVDEKSDD
jgi:hypothetical protein